MNRIRKLIWMHLIRIGVPTSLDGYHYLMSSIELVLVKPGRMRSVTKELYPMVAKEYGTTWARVERSIRNAIEYVFNNTNPEVLFEYFGNTTNLSSGKLSNTQFISGIAEYIRVNEGE